MSATDRANNQLAVFGELLRWILPAARRDPRFPAGLQQRLGRDRRFGSRDRRAYRALAYSAVRSLSWIEAVPPQHRAPLALWLAGDEPALAALRSVALAGWPALPAPLDARAVQLAQRFDRPFAVAELLPDWFATEAPAGLTAESLFTRPPLWLRLQPEETSAVFAWLQSHGIAFAPSPLLAEAIALPAEADVAQAPAFRAGAFEVQDLGSQLVLALARPAPGSCWLDACAGAGGKTLQLARLVGPTGRVEATDPRAPALAELQRRAQRAGRTNIALLPAPPTAGSVYDGVLVDAPCSGSGTWRRQPHLKWQTRATDLQRQAERQHGLLAANAARVRPGGRLVYATCSFAHTENAAVVERFLSTHPDFRVEAPADCLGCASGAFGTTILPAQHNSDGFFVSLLARQPRGG